MAVKIRWTDDAVGDVGAIYAYIARDSKSAADSLSDQIYDTADQAAEFPLAGRTVPEFDKPTIREVFVGSYRLVYRIRKGSIRILRVSHSARVLRLKK